MSRRTKTESGLNKDGLTRIFLIGAGRGGKAVLSRLLRFNWVRIVGVCDLDPKAPGIILAQQAALPVFIGDAIQFMQSPEVNLAFDLTGDQRMHIRLLSLPSRSFDVVTGQVSFLLWSVIHELEEQEIQLRTHLAEHRVLLEINQMLSRSETSQQIFEAIVMGGIRMTGMPAGSLSIFDKEKKQLFLVAAKGFSSDFFRQAIYSVRPGGLTEHILSRNEPVVISNISEYPSFNNPVLLKEGVCSLIAVPLLSEKGPVGILYNDDFKPRTFTPSMLEALRLMAMLAVIAIQKQQAFEEIKSLSIRDPLTGLYNRRYLNEILISEMDRAFRLCRPLSILLIDIDYFKAVNDRFGHIMGDQVLTGLARLFGLMMRPYDTVTRYGGEEFIILMSETDEAEALAAAERLREAAASERFLPEDTPVTCSFGISTIKGEEDPPPTLEEFIHRADKALYEAKRAGRNRVHIFRTDSTSSESEIERRC
jgi:diguanylate cyclase (GGDEF)-like protein